MRNFLLLVVFVFLFGCVATNTQEIILPNDTKVLVTTPKDQKNPATIKLEYTYEDTSNTLSTLVVETDSGTQFNTVRTKALAKQFQVYHFAGIGLLLFGVFLIVIRKPPEIFSGIGVIVGGIALGVLGSILPVIAQYALPIMGVVIVAGLIYVFIYRRRYNSSKGKPTALRS